MAATPHNAGDTDPTYWDERFDKLERKLQTFQATCVRNSTEAAAKVAHTLARETAASAAEVKRDLMVEMAAVKTRAEGVQKQLGDINQSITNLASAKLLQQGMFGILLGCLFTVIFKILGG